MDKKKYGKPTHSVAPAFEAVLLKATGQCAELKDLHSDIRLGVRWVSQDFSCSDQVV